MQGRTLIFTACYNERENIGLLIDQVASVVPEADILVVDDNSPDGTWDVLQEKKREHPQLICVQRPRKLGIGSAHKYALFYAMREGYKTLVTMDADFSHDPRAIPALLAAHGPKAFVTGSRYCEGGKSDYTGYRDFVSRMGNIAARWIWGQASRADDVFPSLRRRRPAPTAAEAHIRRRIQLWRATDLLSAQAWSRPARSADLFRRSHSWSIEDPACANPLERPRPPEDWRQATESPEGPPAGPFHMGCVRELR